jgi:TonB-linked SusC/RagA family outer membrane protein
MLQTSSYRTVRLLVAGLVALVLGALPLGAAAVAQGTGTVQGRVVDATNLSPLAGAQVIVVGTQLGALADPNGHYTITDVPAGQHDVRVRLIGYEQASKTITVTEGGVATADFQLGVSAVSLEEVVVTATGTQRSKELGNSVSTLDVAQEAQKQPNADFTQLLQGRVTGVTIRQSSGSVGTASDIKIRGATTLGLSNTPIVYVDGARIDNNNDVAGGVGGQSYTRLNDINPQDIASIEVVKGPAAAALYGTEASAGVIRITTKKGESGQTRYSLWTEQGANWDATNWWSMAWDPAKGLGLEILTGVAPVHDTVYDVNLLEGAGPFKSPFRKGYMGNYGASIRGGESNLSYYLSGEYRNDQGDLPSNSLERYNARANLSAHPNEKVDISVNTGYVSSTTALPENDNNLFGVVGNALGTSFWGPINRPDPTSGGAPVQSCFLAYEYALATGSSLQDATSNLCDSPYFVAVPNSMQKIFSRQNNQSVERFTGSVNLTYRPMSFWTNRLTVGYDANSARTDQIVPVDPTLPFGDQSLGLVDKTYGVTRDITLDATSSVVANLTPDITSTTTVGGQWVRQTTQQTEAIGRHFTAGSPAVSNSVTNEASDAFVEVKTAGVFGQEQLSWKDRIFLTPALRLDDNSAFGSELGLKAYPQLQFSWILSDEAWFPTFFQQFKLRSAWGESGKQPGTEDALALLSPIAVSRNGQDLLGVTANQPGNDSLKPETGQELEVGFDASMLDSRLNLQVTYYTQKTKDAIVQRQEAPSTGFPSTSARFVNVGELTNKGLEVGVTGVPLQMEKVQWQMRVNFSTNTNKVTKLPEPIVFGDQRHQQGFPAGAYFARPVSLDGSGNVTIGDTAVFLGTPTPKWFGSVSSTVTLFHDVTLYGLLDFSGGNKLDNGLESFSCGLFGGGDQFGTCPAIFQTDASGNLTDQAKIKDAAAGAGVETPFIYSANYAKIRTISLRLDLPESLVRRLPFSSAAITLSGNNLATFTNYPGTDPELNFAGGASFTRAQLWTLPPARSFTGRLSVTF